MEQWYAQYVFLGSYDPFLFCFVISHNLLKCLA